MNLATAGGLAAILLWSSTIAVARSLSEQLGPLTAAAAVYLIGGVLCLLHWGRRHAVRPGDYRRQLSSKYVFGCGALFILYTVCLYLAVGLAANREQALEIGLINYLWPSSTILLSLVLLDKRARPLLWPGTALALAGIFLVMTQGARVSWTSLSEHLRTNPAAFALAFVAAVSWALYSNLARRWSREGSPGAVEFFIAATGLVLLAARYVTPEATTWSWRAIIEASLLGGVTALAYALWDVAMRRGNLLLVAACSYFTPLLSTLVSCVYLKVVPTSKLWIGCLLLIGGSLISWRSVYDRTAARPAENVIATSKTEGV